VLGVVWGSAALLGADRSSAAPLPARPARHASRRLALGFSSRAAGVFLSSLCFCYVLYNFYQEKCELHFFDFIE